MNNKGFSLIEVLLSMTLIAIVIPTVGAILMTILRQQLVVNQLSMMKREGDAIAQIIKREIEQEPVQIYMSTTMTPANLRCHPSRINATTPTEFLSSNTSPIFFLRRDGTYFTFQRNTAGSVNILRRNLNNTTFDNIHSQIVQMTSFRLECLMQSQYGSPLVNAVFTIAPRIQSRDPALQKRLYYQIRVKASTF